MERIRNNIPYYIEHAFVALALMVVVGGITQNPVAGEMAGMFFYIGREMRDREKLGRWDWPGLIAPIVACLIALAILQA